MPKAINQIGASPVQDFEIEVFKFSPTTLSAINKNLLTLSFPSDFFLLDEVKLEFGIFNHSTSEILVLGIEKIDKSGFMGCSKSTEIWLKIKQTIKIDVANAGDQNHLFNPIHF